MVWSAQESKFVSLMIESIISMTWSLCVSSLRTVLGTTGPFPVIKPFLTLWLGFGGDGCFNYLSPTEGPIPFLFGRSSLPLFFLLSVPLVTTTEADTEDPLCCYYLRAAAAFLTKALCLPASSFHFYREKWMLVIKVDGLKWIISLILMSTGEDV